MRKLYSVFALLLVASMILAACQAAPTQAPAPQQQPQEKPTAIIQTVVVEKEGETKTIIITATPAPTQPPAAEPEVVKPAILRVNLGTYPDVIDPQKSSFVNEIAHLQLMYQGLTTYNEKLETVPGGAEKWEYNGDATELTFTLRKDLKYSDGSLLNALRYQYAILRNINPETAGEYASITDEILGAYEWRTGTHADGTSACATDACTDEEKAALGEAVKASVAALDASGNACTGYDQADCLTVKIMLSKPAPYFHTVMGLWVTYPAKEENIAEGGENWWNSSKYQVGNGPFILKSLEPFVRAEFIPNPNFHGEKVSYTLEYSYITDSAVGFEAYKNNEFDIIASASEDLEAINNDPTLKAEHLVYPGSCTTVLKLGLGPNSPFTDDIELRRAFAHAFNAEGYARDVMAGLSTPTWSWIPPGYPGYEASDLLKYDPEKAKAALAASKLGSAEEFNKLGLKFTIGDTPRNRVRAEWIINNLKEALGVDIALDPVEPTTWTALTKSPETFPLLALQGWCADYPDPQNWLSVYWRSNTTFAQRQGYINPDFDKLTNEADVMLDPAARLEKYLEAQRILLQSVPSAFGINNTNHYLVKPWVKGIAQTPQDSGFPGVMAPWTITIDTSMIP